MDQGEAREISWMEPTAGGTMLYHVMTSSPNVTKDELLAVANGLSYFPQHPYY
ncbi:hypothetical protein N0M98_32395 [Paenibacillus doosanensis]|uniref:hypothetical protein n=1 Tax=Paenibacillus TaxID=44249 RepID=UPI00201DB403|nr:MULTISPECIES: hypothetical protein [Paenibacillus]MCS7464784.1 hypothetical protein [Paenibacillus doosanensis]